MLRPRVIHAAPVAFTCIGCAALFGLGVTDEESGSGGATASSTIATVTGDPWTVCCRD